MSSHEAGEHDEAPTVCMRAFANGIKVGIPHKHLLEYVRDKTYCLTDRVSMLEVLVDNIEALTFHVEGDYHQQHFHRDLKDICLQQMEEASGVANKETKKRRRNHESMVM